MELVLWLHKYTCEWKICWCVVFPVCAFLKFQRSDPDPGLTETPESEALMLPILNRWFHPISDREIVDRNLKTDNTRQEQTWEESLLIIKTAGAQGNRTSEKAVLPSNYWPPEQRPQQKLSKSAGNEGDCERRAAEHSKFFVPEVLKTFLPDKKIQC